MKNNRRLKIAMLGHKRIPSREGGVEIVVEELATRMAEQGHLVVCYNRSGHHVSGKEYDANSKELYKGVKLKSVFTVDKKGLAAMTSSLFAALRCAFGEYDVVHFHAEGPCAMLWLPKLFKKRCVATIHGLDWQRAKWGGFASKYIKLGEKVAAKYADEIIVLSEEMQNYFCTEYGRETKYIPNGVNLPVIRNADLIRKEYGLENGEYILYLGRLVPEKGIQYLIKAYASITTNKKLVIAGGNSDAKEFVDELKRLASDDKRIIFTGFVQGQILDELYSNAYLYCLPSDLEGMPLTLLEAMSYGNCCVVSNIAECAEVVEDKAVVFEQGDVSDLAAKLQDLCDDETQVRKYKRDAADFICRKYDWNKTCTETLRLYCDSW